ncbi:hypothetical protein KEM56_006688 [Ascosphaera pollenicola]|nr:hypothetical protein KEM56_006688 [Ascosphaera pollenicola]
MGIVCSRPDDPDAALYLKDPTKFSIASLSITNSIGRTLVSLSSGDYPASAVSAKCSPSDDALIEFVQDPDVTSIPPHFLLRLNCAQELYFHFTFAIRQTDSQPSVATVNGVTGSLSQTTDTSVTGLTFAHASNSKELDNLITREFHANPNLQNNSNVQFIGDFNTAGCPSHTFNWTWKWTPPRHVDDKARGWRNSCSFLEYDQRTNRLNTLATFSFWVHDPTDAIPTGLLPPPPQRSISSRSDQPQSGDSTASTLQAAPVSSQTEIPDNASALYQSQSVKVDLHCQRPGEDMSIVEDGPLFRATMKALEQKTGAMRVKMKKVLKKAELAHQAQVSCNEAVNNFIGALAEASSNGIQPAVEHYFDRIARQLLKYEEQNSIHLQKLVIDPLSKLYNYDIKLAESKRKDFEEESKDYYAYVGRYLGQRQDSLKHKKRAESDSKYQNKRRNFELRRFDYSSFMQDLHGGRKEQEMLSHLTRYANFQARSYLATAKNIEAMMPQLEALVDEVTKVDKEFEFQRTEREEKRRTLEKSAKAYVEPEMLAPQGASTPGLSTSSDFFDLTRADSTASQARGLPNYNHSSGSTESKARAVREQELMTGTDGEQRKEGLVWALSRPGSHIDPKGINKQAWHKFWIVLDQGKLSEYSNWKQKLDLHIGPIDLRMASVREARNSERRFCFEVITPAFKRTYQATSEDDMQSWILAISNALQSAVEGRGALSPPPVSEGSTGRDISTALTGRSGHPQSVPASHSVNASSGICRRITVGGRPNYVRDTSSGAYEDNPAKLLQMIRDADPNNKCCADCGSTSKVEWVSINLGMVFCIECSGIHRSLGTHISKVRSLTLDVHSFTIDIVELLIQIGNRVGNAVWEGRLDPSLKPLPTSTREERLKFITAKYSERAFVTPLSPTLSRYSSANETLIASVKKNDIEGVLYGIALRADLNATDRSRGTRAFFLALAAADPAAPSPSMRTIIPNSPSTGGFQATEPRSISFPIAELLVQNGAEVPTETPPIPLSAAAQMYHTQRGLRGSRNSPITFNSHSSPGDVPNSNKVHQSNSTSARVENLSSSLQSNYFNEVKDRDKANKRGSAGARFAGKVASLGLDR